MTRPRSRQSKHRLCRFLTTRPTETTKAQGVLISGVNSIRTFRSVKRAITSRRSILQKLLLPRFRNSKPISVRQSYRSFTTSISPTRLITAIPSRSTIQKAIPSPSETPPTSSSSSTSIVRARTPSKVCITRWRCISCTSLHRAPWR